MITLYNVVSLDGYIARKDGSEHFIPDGLWSSTLEVLRGFPVLVMGRNTYETIGSYGKELLEPFEKLVLKRVVVSRNKSFKVKSGYTLVHTPEEGLMFNSNVLVSAGTTLNNYLLEKNLIDRVILHEIPVAIGEGIPVFDSYYKSLLVLQSESDIGLAKELKYKVNSKLRTTV